MENDEHTVMNDKNNIFVFRGSVVVFSSMVVLALININYAIDDLQMITSFSYDEGKAVEDLIRNVEAGNLDPAGFYNYGYFYHSVCFSIIEVLKILGHMTSVRTVAFVFRFISLAAFVFSTVLVGKITWMLCRNREMSCFSALLFASLPESYFFAQQVHPDLLQVMILCVAILIIMRNHSVRSALVSSVVAGLAFGTKYSGVFLLPFLTVPLGLKWAAENSAKPGQWIRKWAMLFFSCLAVFTAAWLITNPYVLFNLEDFAKDIVEEKLHLAWGQYEASSKNPLLWFPVLAGEFTYAGLIAVLAGTAASVGVLASAIRKEKFRVISDESTRNTIMLLLYFVVGFAYLMMEVNLRWAKYAFHLYPPMIAVGFSGLNFAVLRLKRKVNERVRIFGVIGVFAAMSVLCLSAMKGSDGFSSRHVSEHMIAADFLSRNYNRDTKILADGYSYVPDHFYNRVFHCGISDEIIRKVNPDVLVMTQGCSGRWSWKPAGAKFRSQETSTGSGVLSEIVAQFHRALFRDPKWRTVLEGDRIVVLERVASPEGH